MSYYKELAQELGKKSAMKRTGKTYKNQQTNLQSWRGLAVKHKCLENNYQLTEVVQNPPSNEEKY